MFLQQRHVPKPLGYKFASFLNNAIQVKSVLYQTELIHCTITKTFYVAECENKLEPKGCCFYLVNTELV